MVGGGLGELGQLRVERAEVFGQFGLLLRGALSGLNIQDLSNWLRRAFQLEWALGSRHRQAELADGVVLAGPVLIESKRQSRLIGVGEGRGNLEDGDVLL